MRAGTAEEQSRGELPSGGATTRAQDAAVQVSSIRPALPQYPCRRPQHIQSSTPPRLPGHDAELPSRSCGAVARCRRSVKPDLTLPPLGSSRVAVTRPLRATPTESPSPTIAWSASTTEPFVSAG